MGPIENQGTYALTSRRGVFYGGTSTYGSYAQPVPVTTSGHLYAMDPETGELIWSVVPKEDAPAVTGVTFGADDRLWVLTNGTVTTRNHRNGRWQLVRRHQTGVGVRAHTGTQVTASDAG